MARYGLAETSGLTERESDVLDLAAAGRSNDEIATRLGISRRTVEVHMRALLRKTGASSRSQLAALYHRSAPQQQDPPAGRPAAGGAAEDWRLASLAAAVRGLVDRQFPLFEERVELTLVVGERDGQDVVIERRWTTPRPYLVYRVLGPILADGDQERASLTPRELALSCEVRVPDIQADLHLVDATGRPLVLVLFQPGLSEPVEWVLRYRSPRLWTPLRRDGQDALSWATATFDQHYPQTVTDLTVHVVFPASWDGVHLAEQHDFGETSTQRLPTGQTRITWHQPEPDAGGYRWKLHGSPAAPSDSAPAQQ